MAKKVEPVVKPVEEVKVCLACKGTGRGTPNGVFVTTCPLCKGTGK